MNLYTVDLGWQGGMVTTCETKEEAAAIFKQHMAEWRDVYAAKIKCHTPLTMAATIIFTGGNRDKYRGGISA